MAASTLTHSRAVSRVLGLFIVLFTLNNGMGWIPPVGSLLEPWQGLYRTARVADRLPARATLNFLDQEVDVVRDQRGVPHIFAASEADAIRALGFTVAQDRLFQVYFIPMAAAGRISEVLGPDALEVDRQMRETGMLWGARKNLERIEQAGGIEWDLIRWFSEGVNAYVEGLSPRDYPIEWRLTGYRPGRYEPLYSLLVLQYMAYDLSYETSDLAHTLLRERLGAEEFNRLYPASSPLAVPVIPQEAARSGLFGQRIGQAPVPSSSLGEEILNRHLALNGTFLEGFRPGKGSNNWAVSAAKSTTGGAMMASDMHLSVTLPAIWYEVRLKTPTMDVYGVTVPGAPLPVASFTEHAAWSFTNSGADQLDFYRLSLDESGQNYRYDDVWRPLTFVPDTLRILKKRAVMDTLVYSHHGPVIRRDGEAYAIRWTAHEPSMTLRSLYDMIRSRSYEEFLQALRRWNTPLQNVLYTDKSGVIALHLAGLLPDRPATAGPGVRDGARSADEWRGFVPFDEMPKSVNPGQGFLASANQQTLVGDYPYWMGAYWAPSYRAMRINTLLASKDRHSDADMRAYQGDVYAPHIDLLRPMLDTLSGVRPHGDSLRQILLRWEGHATLDSPAPTVLRTFLRNLRAFAWDEPTFAGVLRPNDDLLWHVMRTLPEHRIWDVNTTEEVEHAGDLLRLVLEATHDTLTARFGSEPDDWQFANHGKILFRHVTRALDPFARGPFPYPGMTESLSPGGGSPTTHSGSWRVVVDFSTSPPQAWGVYPGGQSGNPFSRRYDAFLPTYLAFEHFRLVRPASADAFPAPQRLKATRLQTAR